MHDLIAQPRTDMALVLKIKDFLFKRALRKYKSTNLNHAPADLFAQIKTVGILFDAAEAKNREVILDYAGKLNSSGITTQLLGFIPSKVNGVSFSFDFIDVKNLSFSGIPQGQAIDNFINNRFDLLINLDTSMHKPLTYIAVASKAFFKIGPAHGEHHHYDLMISMQGNDIATYIQEIRTTFNKILG